MLTRHAIFAFVLASTTLVISETYAIADSTHEQRCNIYGTCRVVVESGDSTGPGPTSQATTEGGSSPACINRESGSSVACGKDGRWWSNDEQCYVALAEEQLPKSNWIWDGHTGGAIYTCSDGPGVLPGAMEMLFWAPDPPESPALPPVDPAVLAERAVDGLKLKLAEVHTAPKAPGPTFVNLETWLWVSDSDWRTLTASASARGTTATVTAKPVRVEWDLGEDTHTCDGPGRAWREGLDPDDASCHYKYAHTSEDQPNEQYTISAAIVYDVTWTCEGQCRATSGELGEHTAPQGTATLGVKEAIPVLTGQR